MLLAGVSPLPIMPTLCPVSSSPGFPTVVPPPMMPTCLLISPSPSAMVQMLPPLSSLTHPKPGTHIDSTPSITAIVPGFGSVEVGSDFDTPGGADSIGGNVSVFSSAVICVFSSSISVAAAASSAGVSAERGICVFSSDRASISAVTAVFTGSAGKSRPRCFLSTQRHTVRHRQRCLFR